MGFAGTARNNIRASHRGAVGVAALMVLLVLVGCTAKTNPATNVTATNATLNGQVTLKPGDKGGVIWWEYSRDNGAHWTETSHLAWGNQSCKFNSSGSEGSPIPIHTDVTGLTPASHYIFRIAGTVCNSAVMRFDANGAPNGTAYSAFDTPSSGVPTHIETWAYDDSWPQGANASAAMVAKWVSYAEGFGGTKPVADCHSTGATCKSLAYFDAYRIYYNCGSDCSIPLSSPPNPENWWLHIPGFTDAQHRISAGDTDKANLTNLTVQGVRDWLANYARSHYDTYDGLMVDDSPTNLHLALYPSGYETSNELTTDAQVDSENTQLAAALTHNDGTPFLQVDNGITVNSYLPPGFNRLNNAGTSGLLTEGNPVSNGSFTGYYDNMLDEMAYINTQTSGFMVLLSEDNAGSLQARRDQAASILLGYSPGHEVSWSDLNHPSTDLAVWPEEGIYPTQPVQSMPTPTGPGCLSGDGSACSTGGHNALEVAPGVYRREFSNCYNQGVAFGRCAVIVNWNTSPINTQSSWLTNTYTHQLTMTGGDVQAGGTINLAGAGYAPGTSIAAHDSVILAP